MGQRLGRRLLAWVLTMGLVLSAVGCIGPQRRGGEQHQPSGQKKESDTKSDKEGKKEEEGGKKSDKEGKKEEEGGGSSDKGKGGKKGAGEDGEGKQKKGDTDEGS